MIERASAFRLSVLPDKMVGQLPKTVYNPNLRGGWYKSHVPVRACTVLDAVQPRVPPNRLDEMKAICHLVGVLDLNVQSRQITPDALNAAGFEPLVVLGTRLVQGQPFDSPHSYFRKLAIGFDIFKLVKGALCIAEVEDVLALPLRNLRRRKTIGYARNTVGRLLESVPVEGREMSDLLKNLLPPLYRFHPE